MAEGRRRVHERFGVTLEPEVQVLGEVALAAGVGAGMSGATVALPRRARGRIRVLRRRLIVAALAAALLLALYMLWFRDSSLVAVKTVKVDGTGKGPLERQLDAELSKAARKMTTLHVDQKALADVAKRFTLVESVSADPSFPSSLTIHVVERRPAALIGEGSGAVAVAGDGVILRGLPAEKPHLPQLPLSSAPRGRSSRARSLRAGRGPRGGAGGSAPLRRPQLQRQQRRRREPRRRGRAELRERGRGRRRNGGPPPRFSPIRSSGRLIM